VLRIVSAPIAANPGITMSPTRMWVTLVALSMPILALSVDMNGVVVLLPQIASDLGVSAAAAGAVVTISSVSFAAPLLLVGRAADRFGARPLLLWGVALFWMGSAVCAFTDSFTLMLAGRSLQGIASACCFTTSLATIDAIFDRRREPVAVGIWAAIGGLGGAAGPIVASVLASVWSWRAFFGVNLVLIAVAFVMLVVLVPRLPGDPDRSMRIVPLVALMIGIAGVVTGIQHSSAGGWGSPLTIVPIVIGAVALFATWRLRHPDDPLVPRTVSSNLSFRLGTAEATLSNWGSGVVMVLVPIALQVIRHLSVMETGMVFLAFSAPFAVGGAISGPLVNKLTGRTVLAASSTLLASGTVVLVYTGATGSLVLVVVGLAVAGLGNGVIYSTATSVALVDVEPADAGEASAVLSMLRVLGLALAVALSTSLMHAFDADLPGGEWGLRIVLLVAAAITAAGVPVALRRPRAAK
jgi:MFS family permease